MLRSRLGMNIESSSHNQDRQKCFEPSRNSERLDPMSKTCERKHQTWALAVLLFLIVGAPSWATTLMRASLEDLVQENEIILVGEVVDAYSYWNEDRSFIMTDLTVVPEMVFKGSVGQSVTVTVMGGTVDELTAVIVAGAQLSRDESYLLFLGEADLKTGQPVLTVREHSQGVFEFALNSEGDLVAISQANKHELMEDADGQILPPGGTEGLPQSDIFQSISDLIVTGGK